MRNGLHAPYFPEGRKALFPSSKNCRQQARQCPDFHPLCIRSLRHRIEGTERGQCPCDKPFDHSKTKPFREHGGGGKRDEQVRTEPEAPKSPKSKCPGPTKQSTGGLEGMAHLPRLFSNPKSNQRRSARSDQDRAQAAFSHASTRGVTAAASASTTWLSSRSDQPCLPAAQSPSSTATASPSSTPPRPGLIAAN